MRFAGSAVYAIVIALWLGSSAAAQPAAPVPPDFETTVQTVLESWAIPGAGVAVVQHGELAYVQGFGQREIDRPEEVDGDTIFGVASVTKLFVTTAVAVLVEEGKIDLDIPVVEYLPDFRVADEYTSQHVTLRDLLSHRSGIDFAGTGEAVIEQIAHWDSSDIVARSRHLPQEFPLREEWRYNDFGFLVAAEVISRLSGEPWWEFIRNRVAIPLDMQSTWATPREFLPSENILPSGDGWSARVPRGIATLPPATNIATPHLIWSGMEPHPFLPELTPRASTAHFHRSPIDPCQSAWSSARDLALFAAMWLNGGRHGTTRFLKPETVADVNRLAIARDPAWPLSRRPLLDARDATSSAYQVGQAAGFAIFDYAGHILAGHDGGELGYSSLLRIDRARGLGVVVLVNNAVDRNGSLAKTILAHAILDWHYGLQPLDRNSLFLAEYERTSRKQAEVFRAQRRTEEADRDLGRTPSQPPRAYAGSYTHPFAGELKISLRDGNQLVASVGESAEWLLKPWRGDLFAGDWQGAMPTRQYFRFAIRPAGEPESVEIVGESLKFTRVSDAALR